MKPCVSGCFLFLLLQPTKSTEINARQIEQFYADAPLKLLENYNRYHNKTPIICGISEPRYDKKELAELKARDERTFDIDGHEITGYEASQAMRRLETGIREQKGIKAMAQASGDPLAVRECNARINRYQDKYAEISDITGIAQDKKRMTLTKGADGGKINLNRTAKRRTKNLSNFSNLEVTMQKRNVLRTADKYDVSTKGLTFKIQRSEKLLSMPYYGSTDYDNIGRIDLFPNAFVNEEQLIRTILHEKCHVNQLQKYGKNYVQANIPLMERQAERFEKLYYSIQKKRVK